MKKIKQMIFGVFGWIRRLPWRAFWKWTSIVLLIVSVVGSAVYLGFSSYDKGYEHGKREGQCQVGCAFLEMEYEYYDDEGRCWCASGTNARYAVPLKKDF